MEKFKKLALKIEEEWRQAHYDIDCFPSIAEQSLSSGDWAMTEIDDICDWVFNAKEFVNQVNINVNFGEPPITVFANEKFYIEILFWLSSTTSIHQHGFRGAFYVLSGSSIHTQYSFTEKIRINEHLLFGDIETVKIEVLQKGQYRKIDGGNSFIHSLFHLDYPSVSVVIRTYSDPAHPIQFQYLKPNVALHSFYRDQRMTREIQMLKMLKKIDKNKFSNVFMHWAGSADLHKFVNVLFSFAYDGFLSTDEVDKVLSLAELRYPDYAPFLKDMYHEIERKRSIQNARNFIVNPVHRFFMALLLNASSTEQVLQIIKERYPLEAPMALLNKWIMELNEDKKFSNVFDEFQLELIEAMLASNSIDGVVSILKEKYEEEQIEQNLTKIKDLYIGFKRLPIFKVLFSQHR